MPVKPNTMDKEKLELTFSLLCLLYLLVVGALVYSINKGEKKKTNGK
jgi:CHASE3 domain sensor protein